MSANTDRFTALCAKVNTAIAEDGPGMHREIALALYESVKLAGDLLIELEELRAEKIRVELFNDAVKKGLGILAGGAR
jgi:hypothetical protein